MRANARVARARAALERAPRAGARTRARSRRAIHDGRARGRRTNPTTTTRSALERAEADDFEITTRLGSVTLRTERPSASAFAWRASADGGAPESVAASSVEEEVDDGAARVNVYAGRYVHTPSVPPISRNADRGAVMLKEYAGERAAAFAETEVRAYERLLADDDVEIEVDEYGRGPGMLPQKALPIARLVGYFASASIDGDGTRSLWTAQEWHGVRRLSEYARAKQEGKSETKFWPPVQRVQDQPKKARARYVRRAFEQCLKGVWYAHQRGVAHGALDGSTFLCSTFLDTKADDLEVRLINFGCSTLCTPTSVVVDLKAMALVLTELVFASLAAYGPSDATSAEALRRVFVDIHELDFKRIRAYCEEEPDWTDACEFLSDNGGEYWELLRELWQAEELMDGYGVTTNAGALADRAEYLRELLERH